MYNIKTLNNIAQIGLDVFDKSKYAVSAECENPDAIIVRSAKMHDYSFNSELLCIARAGAGTNNIPSDKCAENGIVVFNTPGANAEAVKELALCAMLMASRDVYGGVTWVKSIADKGDEVAALVEKGKSAFTGPEIMGKKLGVIGLGAVGAKLADAAVLLGMQVYGYDPFISVDAAWKLNPAIIKTDDIETIYRNCDYISIHIPYMKSTHHFIDKAALDMMKDGVRIINLARAELISDDDIIAAIKAGKVAKYVTDFANGKTADVDGIVAMPHLGASTPESEDNCAVMAAHEIIDYVENGNIVNSVNMPRVSMAKSGEKRLCIIAKNSPDVTAQYTAKIADSGVATANTATGTTKDGAIAYTVIDLNGNTDGLCEAVAAIDGVIRARII